MDTPESSRSATSLAHRHDTPTSLESALAIARRDTRTLRKSTASLRSELQQHETQLAMLRDAREGYEHSQRQMNIVIENLGVHLLLPSLSFQLQDLLQRIMRMAVHQAANLSDTLTDMTQQVQDEERRAGRLREALEGEVEELEAAEDRLVGLEEAGRVMERFWAERDAQGSGPGEV